MLRSKAQTMPLITADSFQSVAHTHYDLSRPLAAPIKLDPVAARAYQAISLADNDEGPKFSTQPAPLLQIKYGEHSKQCQILTPSDLERQYRFDPSSGRYFRLFQAIPVKRHSIFVTPAQDEIIIYPGNVLLRSLSGTVESCTDRYFLHNCRVNIPILVDWKKFDQAVSEYARQSGMSR